jgi:hypothetical protein
MYGKKCRFGIELITQEFEKLEILEAFFLFLQISPDFFFERLLAFVFRHDIEVADFFDIVFEFLPWFIFFLECIELC